MALKWFEGWDYLPPGAAGGTALGALLASLGIYDLYETNIVAGGRFGGNAIATLNETFIGNWTRAFPSSFGTAQLGGARVSTGAPGDRVNFLDLATGTVQCYVTFDDYGIIRAWRGDGTLLGASAPGSYVSAVWAFYEFGVTIGTAGGALTVRVNTVPVLALSSVSTQVSANASFSGVSFNTQIVSWDDLYLTDTTGSAPLNGFLGNVRVRVLSPNGAGASTLWTPSNGSLANWQCVLNEAVDDTLYVYDANAGDYDLYTLTPILPDVAVFGAQTKFAARQDDATQRFLKTRLFSAGATAYGASVALNQNYAYQVDVFPTNPATGAAWTAAALNAAQIGPQVAS